MKDGQSLPVCYNLPAANRSLRSITVGAAVPLDQESIPSHLAKDQFSKPHLFSMGELFAERMAIPVPLARID